MLIVEIYERIIALFYIFCQIFFLQFISKNTFLSNIASLGFVACNDNDERTTKNRFKIYFKAIWLLKIIDFMINVHTKLCSLKKS